MPKLRDYMFGGIPAMGMKAINKNGGFGEWLFGKEASTERKSFQTPLQEQMFNQLLLGLGGQGGQSGGNPALQYLQQYLNPNQQQGFEQFSQPYMQNFQEKVLPQIAERFAGGGALSSSGFGQAIGGAASGLQSELAQQYGQRQMQSSTTLLNLLQNLLGQQTFGYQQNEANPGLIGSALTAFAGGLGKGIGGGGFG